METNNAPSRPPGGGGQSSNGPRPAPNPDRPSNATKPSGVVQPKPQALPKRSGPAAIIVSPRQKGNRLLELIRSVPWEYGDIPADYLLGLTTCALFLSLKYHRLHPEYIYTRIKALQGKYALRVVLCLVDINNHEDPLRELSKTSLINNVTLVLCWSAAEGARYLELFKTYENAAPTSIRQHQSTKYADRMVDFITTPRSINKTDAVALVSQFGSLRTAVNARHEDVSGIAGWGEKKVDRWCGAVKEPFRVKVAAKRGLVREESSTASRAGGQIGVDEEAVRELSGSPALSYGGPSGVANRPGTADADRRPGTRLAEEIDPIEDAEDLASAAEAMVAAPVILPKKVQSAPSEKPPAKKRKKDDDLVNDGVMAALSKLRKDGG